MERIHSARKARTGSIEAARSAGMKPAIAAADTSTAMAMAMVRTGILTLVMSYRVGADARCQRQQRGDRVARRVTQLAECITQILQ